MTRYALALALFAALSGCSDAPTQPAEPAPPPIPPELPPLPPARYGLHEWGLFGVDATSPGTATIGTVVSHPPAVAGLDAPAALDALDALEEQGRAIPADIPVHDPRRFGLQAQGGKPVIYLHVLEGAPHVQVSVGVRLPTDGLLEHWPPTTVTNGMPTWNVNLTRGACVSPLTPPSSESEACRGVRDAFCEAAEIPRYYGANDTCLRMTETESELLFYRGAGLDASSFPLALGRQGRNWTVSRRTPAAIEGPVLLVELVRGQPRLRALTPPEYPMPPEDDAGITPDAARELLRNEAIRRGLLPAEADAFLDAWSPAYFGPCLRTGPVAHGEPPVSLAEAGRALLYFAPEEVVDRVLPLELTPAPAERHRVFLVRYVDPASRVRRPR